jgi:CheY-like chemotaxis protein
MMGYIGDNSCGTYLSETRIHSSFGMNEGKPAAAGKKEFGIRPQNILLVDDEKDFADLLARELEESFGYKVNVCGSGEEALDVLTRESFDVILLDYKLPGISGLAVLQWLNEQKIETPVIFFTAYGPESVVDAATKLGAYDFIRRENLDHEHLPVLLNGTYERFLFRKEKERRDKEQRELETRIAAIEMFRNTVDSIAHYVNHALSILAMDTSHYEKILSDIAPEAREQVQRAFDEMRQEMKIIEAGMKSMLSLSDMVYAKYSGEKDISELQSQLQQALQLLQQKETK